MSAEELGEATSVNIKLVQPKKREREREREGAREIARKRESERAI
jgi:hypothetical protein